MSNSRENRIIKDLVMMSIKSDKVYGYDTRRIDDFCTSLGLNNKDIEELKEVSYHRYTSKKAPTSSVDA